MYELFSTTPKTWEKQLEDIHNAQSTIYFEQYILSSLKEGEIGRKYVDAFIKKAKQGVEVHLILDFQGSSELFRSSDLNTQLMEAGVIIHYYKTAFLSNVFSPVRILLRNHRKLLLVDHKITWVGGVVVGEGFREWSDFMARFESVVMADYSNREFRRQLRRITSGKTILAPLDRVDEDYQIVGNSPGLGNRYCYEFITHQILLAQKSVVLVTPYFSPPFRMRQVIKRRLREGLEITLVIPRKSDHAYADWTREIFLKGFIKKGLIVHYLDFMNHAKIVVADNDWCTFGSTNIDVLSLVANHELNVTSTNKKFIQDTLEIINAWKLNGRRAFREDLEYVHMTAWQKFIGRLGKYFV